MKHPSTLALRRHNRQTIMARRRQQMRDLWSWWSLSIKNNTLWNYCDKTNLGCGSRMCHAYKYGKDKRKRRRGLDRAVIDNIRSFEEYYIERRSVTEIVC